jgi:lipopolysaccharide transport system ATP-binding protein
MFNSSVVEDFWALREVGFELAPGEVLGVIGPNGAGKSTLFKLLSSITAPTEGEIRFRGRLAALIEVGSGFHPELTGRENVFLSGTILGMRRRDIATRLESIVAFAGIGNFLDVPVKWYSSGMYVRLGFAVAAHLEPDILLVDEVLAVGDAEFQARCLRRIQELRQRGTTILFISHDLGTVERLCDRALLLRNGRIAAEGTARDVVTTYQKLTTEDDPATVATDRGPERRVLEIVGLNPRDPDGSRAGIIATGAPLRLEVELIVRDSCPRVVVQAMLYSYNEGILLFECTTPPEGMAMEPGSFTVRFDMPAVGLVPGSYTLGATVRRAEETRAIDWWFGRTTLHVDVGPQQRGHFAVPYSWSLQTMASPVMRR